MKGKRKTFFFLFLLFLPILYAQNPFTQQSTGELGLELEVTSVESIKVGESYHFSVHVFNASTDLPISENVNCIFHLYNLTGGHQFEDESNTPEGQFDYEFMLNGDNFTVEGIFPYMVQCNTSGAGGFKSGVVHVNEENRPYHYQQNQTESTGLNVFLIMFIMSLVFIVLAHAFKDEHHSAFVYGIISATISFLLFAMMIGGMRVIKNITMIVDVNYYIGLLVLAMGIYGAVIGNVFYQERKAKIKEMNGDND